MCRFRTLACPLLLLFLLGCGPSKVAEPIWLGHLAPLSGTNRARGEEASQAMQLVLESAREKDWQVLGRSLGVRHVDANGDRARAEAVRLLSVNRVVGLIVGPGLSDADEVANAARTHEAPVVILDEVTEVPAGPGVITLGPDPARRGRALAQFAGKQWNKRRVAVLLNNRDRISATVAGAFTAAWRQAGGSHREYSVGEKVDLSSLKAELKKHQEEIVLAAMPVVRLRELATALAAVPILYGGPDVDEDELLRQAAALPAGAALYAATAFTAGATLSESGKQWYQRFDKSQRKPPGRSAALACDGLRLMMSALEQVKAKGSTPLRTLLREELSGTKEFESVAGKVAWKDSQAVRPLFLVRFAAGKPTVLASVTGDES
jgi:ABC-type branched-subunit amino acid transport system substrate-binding protein